MVKPFFLHPIKNWFPTECDTYPMNNEINAKRIREIFAVQVPVMVQQRKYFISVYFRGDENLTKAQF